MPFNKTTQTGGYENEPYPRLERKSPFESKMERFCYAAGLLNLHERMFRYLAGQVKQVTVSISVVTNFGEIDGFKEYRVIHDNVLGPDRVIPAPDMDTHEQIMA
ncbi:MAG: hypothetical protein R3281_16275 [Balneolaceae bacterium]|nr:hypothetical protein [Balneolaceae bacterium]